MLVRITEDRSIVAGRFDVIINGFPVSVVKIVIGNTSFSVNRGSDEMEKIILKFG